MIAIKNNDGYFTPDEYFDWKEKQLESKNLIVVCSDDRDWEALAQRIHQAILENESLQGKLIRIVRPEK